MVKSGFMGNGCQIDIFLCLTFEVTNCDLKFDNVSLI